MKTFFLFIILFQLFIGFANSQDKQYYYYKPENTFGSDLNFHPITTLVNGSFDILRNGGHSKQISNISFHHGFYNIFSNIFDPFLNIKKYGSERFTEEEIFNLRLTKDYLQFIPNYSNHIFGGGIIYVKLAEWYDYHGSKHPKLLSLGVSTIYQIMNEAIENGDYRGVNMDPISDLLIFNPLGYLLFSSNRFNRIFSKYFHANEWSLQPIINIQNEYLENTGQQFIIKYNLPGTERYGSFIYWGLNGLAGISYKLDKTRTISLGAGTYVNKLIILKHLKGRTVVPDADGAIGVFYDKNNSLMASGIFTGPKLYNFRMNIYPKLLNIFGKSPGVFLGFGEWDNLVFGFSFNLLSPGLGIGNTDKIY